MPLKQKEFARHSVFDQEKEKTDRLEWPVCGQRRALLTDAEAGKNPPQQIVGAECAGNFPQGMLSLSQILCQQLAGTRQSQLSTTMLEGSAGMTQCVQVTPACAEAAFRRLFITHAGLEVITQ